MAETFGRWPNLDRTHGPVGLYFKQNSTFGIFGWLSIGFCLDFDEHLTERRRGKETVGTPEYPDHCLGSTTLKLDWRSLVDFVSSTG